MHYPSLGFSTIIEISKLYKKQQAKFQEVLRTQNQNIIFKKMSIKVAI